MEDMGNYGYTLFRTIPNYVGILGLEPRMTGPESVVLPLHHIPFSTDNRAILLNCECKGSLFFV